MKSVKVYTNSSFNDTIKIVKYLEPVTYHVVLGVNFFADWVSSWTDFLGGKSQSYQNRLSAINKEVIEGIQTKVLQLGGNGAIDLKIDNDEISAQGKSMIMVTAIATAVIIKEVEIVKSKTEDMPLKGIKAITNTDFLSHKRKQEIRSTINESKNIGPLNRLVPAIQPEHYDVVHELFQAINIGDFDPRDFTKESFIVIRDMLVSLDLDSRSETLYRSLRFINDERNEVNYKLVKYIFYINLIEDTNCVDYNCINDILPQITERLKQHFIEHYIRGLDKKSLFYPMDIKHLELGKDLLGKLNVDEIEYLSDFNRTIEYLEELFS